MKKPHMQNPVFVDNTTPGTTYVGFSDEDRANARPSEAIFHIQKITVVDSITTIQDNKGIKEKISAWTDRANPALWS